MTEPTASYPDSVWHGRVPIEQNVLVARQTYRLRIAASQIARRIAPGQFLMLRLPDVNDPLLGRPFALYDTVLDAGGEPVGVDIVYRVVGKMTERLARMGAGEWLEVWGPLGNGFHVDGGGHLVLVAGGIGQTPLLALARHSLGLRQYGQPARPSSRAEKVTLCYGERSADLLAGVSDFEQIGVEVRVSTEDGSAGHRGLVTDLIPALVTRSPLPCQIVSCGPEKMMAATVRVARQFGVRCWVSLESPMACGIGICFSCVARVRQATGQWDYRRVCIEGPVFDGEQIEF